MTNDDQILDFLYARQFAYDVLRRLFMEEPTPELLSYLSDSGLLLFPCDEALPAMKNAINEMHKDLNNRRIQANTEDFENLHWDFTRLFIGPEAPPAAPWESTYVSRDKLLFQESTLAVKSFYEQYGVHLPEGDMEAADHIGYELDFMWHLSLRITEFIDSETENVDWTKVNALLLGSATFLNTHLLAFITPFCRSMYNHAETVFYRQLSSLLELFLRNDIKKINELVNL
ncbi:molecular chaperone [Providencia hangzhouensis]|uniref:Twin-arginine leader-binding protein DmsD n=3 Tax=Providencia TaxID=586 RepID=A0A9N8D0H7_PRORE|nr:MULTISPECIES: molecular chaperone TorD family protein [Providencia]MBN7843826.1 molecular chaperone TorD family protein [Providencia rettgeri]MBN7855051.1 molecular chaperone TorD family protein [Providencia rettgeri]MBN7862917.1 molecular chaperone TorD family protein [Providencia rettgeri]MBN7874306.1 molecular chaperone TorD family protein [Providencia rettgeri]MBN7897836.1 molecular chaperone TorD family protein [Providencia rettgeri]